MVVFFPEMMRSVIRFYHLLGCPEANMRRSPEIQNLLGHAALPWARAWQEEAWLPKEEFQGFSEVVLGVNKVISLAMGGFGEKL